jgi:hypothetical protein
VKRIVRYLKKTSDFGTLYERDPSKKICGYVNAGLKSDPVTSKSQGGYVFKLGEAAISSKSRKQTVAATSTAHAELIALYEGTRVAVWLRWVMSFIGSTTRLLKETQLIPLLEDNEACIAQIQKGFVRSNSAKHVDPRYYHWIVQENGTVVDVQPVSRQKNTANVFTKALPANMHQYHVKGLGLKSQADVNRGDTPKRRVLFSSCRKKL